MAKKHWMERVSRQQRLRATVAAVSATATSSTTVRVIVVRLLSSDLDVAAGRSESPALLVVFVASSLAVADRRDAAVNRSSNCTPTTLKTSATPAIIAIPAKVLAKLLSPVADRLGRPRVARSRRRVVMGSELAKLALLAGGRLTLLGRLASVSHASRWPTGPLSSTSDDGNVRRWRSLVVESCDAGVAAGGGSGRLIIIR